MIREIFSTLFILVSSPVAMAQMHPATVNMVLPSVEESVARRSEKSDIGCPRAGSKVDAFMSLDTGSAFSANGILNDLVDQNQTERAELESDQSHCGSRCQEVNSVSKLTTTVPTKYKAPADCQIPTPRVIEQVFPDEATLKSFVSHVFRGSNDVGKQLAAQCPNPCSYSIGSSVTPGPNGTQHLSLSVLCGPPRDGSIFFATYFYSAGLIQQWTCKKP